MRLDTITEVAWSLFGHSLTPHSPETKKNYAKLLIEMAGRVPTELRV